MTDWRDDKPCEHCGKTFTPYRPTHRWCSKHCQSRNKERLQWECGHRKKNQKKLNDYNRNYARKHRAVSHKWRLKNAYGLTPEQYQEMSNKQNNVCAICRKPETRKGRGGANLPLSVDHDHNTGKVRELLCQECNLLLGYSHDNIVTLANAIGYLKKWITN
jgi:hypothetical protein